MSAGEPSTITRAAAIFSAPLADIDLARNEVVASAVEINGSLRVGAPSQFGVRNLVPAVAAFMARYPALNVELVLSDQLVDPQAAGLDLLLRFGHPADSRLRQHRLGTSCLFRRDTSKRWAYRSSPGAT